jgi:tetratricopeptide (TPR) repeat protein
MESESVVVMESKKEQKYQKAVDLMKSIRCMTTHKDKVDMYLNLSERFSKLAEYKDSDEYSLRCKQLAKQTEDEIIKQTYNKAQEYKNKAKLPRDYQIAADEFIKVSGYMDADEMASQCRQLRMGLEKSSITKRLIANFSALLCIVVVIIGISTPHAKYYLANVYMTTGVYEPAIKIYKKLSPFKDSEHKLVQSQYLGGLDYEAEGDFKKAEKLFSAAKDYKDSREKKVDMVKLIIKNSKVGDVVKLGNSEWILLEYNSHEALLMKKVALSGLAYNDEFQDITWENSTLRQYLNSNFLTETFTEEEKNNIILTDVKNNVNTTYSTDAGKDTWDYIFLMSIDEAIKYNSLFPVFKNNSWLRSPGNSRSSAAFLSVKGTVMDYGYEIASEDLTSRPILWFNLQ